MEHEPDDYSGPARRDRKGKPNAVRMYLMERKLLGIINCEVDSRMKLERLAGEVGVDLFEMEDIIEGTAYQLTLKQLKHSIIKYKKSGITDVLKYLNEIRIELIRLEEEYER